jgi:hypothetical protein
MQTLERSDIPRYGNVGAISMNGPLWIPGDRYTEKQNGKDGK